MNGNPSNEDRNFGIYMKTRISKSNLGKLNKLNETWNFKFGIDKYKLLMTTYANTQKPKTYKTSGCSWNAINEFVQAKRFPHVHLDSVFLDCNKTIFACAFGFSFLQLQQHSLCIWFGFRFFHRGPSPKMVLCCFLNSKSMNLNGETPLGIGAVNRTCPQCRNTNQARVLLDRPRWRATLQIWKSH